ncbi:hypothetical protein IE53DRAFT_163688 [Violaceomyces palustris]|uniref:Uncharacterized protein n=1 Tax=Violaceomyces palustris TaxID=1673888 RepID=A0ACD0NTE3_9BASI|nr:hypothetical protein IE53DRAFT_163688 [Violaceomyces palustris]
MSSYDPRIKVEHWKREREEMMKSRGYDPRIKVEHWKREREEMMKSRGKQCQPKGLQGGFHNSLTGFVWSFGRRRKEESDIGGNGAEKNRNWISDLGQARSGPVVVGSAGLSSERVG